MVIINIRNDILPMDTDYFNNFVITTVKYSLDTPETFKDRIVNVLNNTYKGRKYPSTLPLYIHSTTENGVLYITDIMYIIKKVEFTLSNIRILYPYFEHSLFNVSDILKMWIHYYITNLRKTSIGNWEDYRRVIHQTLLSTKCLKCVDEHTYIKNCCSHSIDEHLVNMEELPRHEVAFVDIFTQQEVELLNRKVNQLEQFFVESLQGFVLEQFKQLEIIEEQYQIECEIPSLPSLFNQLVTNSTFTYITYGTFSKIYNGSLIPEWKIKTDEIYIYMLLDSLFIEIQIIQKESNMFIQFNMTNKLTQIRSSENICASIKEFITVQYTSDFVISNQTIIYNYPLQHVRFNKYIVLDNILLNSFLNTVMYVNEKEQTSKKFNSVGIHTDEHFGNISANVSEHKKTDKGEELYYIRIRIKTPTIQMAQLFFNLLYISFTYHSESIITFYNERIDKDLRNYPNTKSDQEIKLTRNERTDSLIKTANYSRLCQQMPTLLIPDEPVPPNVQPPINFPIGTEDRYICNNKEHPTYRFPGLKENTKNTFMFKGEKVNLFPCCYENNQYKINSGSKFMNYYYNEPLKIKTSATQLYLSPNRLVPSMKKGIIPNTILRILNLYTDTDCNYVRYGIREGPNTFLHCVLLATTQLQQFTDEELRTERHSLQAFASTCRQELYDKTDTDIKDFLTTDTLPIRKENSTELQWDINHYLDPTLFIHCLETKYKCQIILFKNNSIQIPRHKESYIRNIDRCETTLPTICIIEHETKKHCELIIFDIDSQIIYNKNRSILYKSLSKIYNELSFNSHSTNMDKIKFVNKRLNHYRRNGTELKTAALLSNSDLERLYEIVTKIDNNKKILLTDTITTGLFYSTMNVTKKLHSIFKEMNPTIYNPPSTLSSNIFITPIAQSIDLVGKTRLLWFSYNDIEIYCITPPLQPLNLPIFPMSKVNIQTDTNIYSFLDSLFIRYQTTHHISTIISLQDTSFSFNISVSFPITTIHKSLFTNFIYYQKISRYIIEYLFWYFSKTITSVDDLQQHIFETFINEQVVIDSIQYKPFMNEFVTTDTLVTKNQRIIIPIDVKEKLLFILKLYAERYPQKLIEYKNHKYIPSFYTNTYDFVQNESETILSSFPTTNNYELHRTIEHPFPFFYHNLFIRNDTILLATNQQTDVSCILEPTNAPQKMVLLHNKVVSNVNIPRTIDETPSELLSITQNNITQTFSNI